jgi:HK97 family phage prohead protease
MTVQRRAFALGLEVRGGDGRTVFGRIVPYGEVIRFVDSDGQVKRERFAPGAFAEDARAWHRVMLSFEHERGFASTIGYGVQGSHEEREDGAYASFRLYKQDSDKAREALTSSHRGLSLEFYPLVDRIDVDGTIVRERVRTERVSAVPDPAYSQAEVLSVRANDRPPSTPNLDETRAFLAQLRRERGA